MPVNVCTAATAIRAAGCPLLHTDGDVAAPRESRGGPEIISGTKTISAPSSGAGDRDDDDGMAPALVPAMSRPPQDLAALGARALPTRSLLRVLLGPRVDDDVVDDAAAALFLHPRAREAALLRLAHGPRLLAAVELGRRAWMATPPLGTRLQGPADVAAIAGPLLVDERRPLVVCLDVRGRVARMAAVDDDDDVTVLQEILVAGCRRGIVCRRLSGLAVPTHDDVARLTGLRRAGALVGIDVADGVLLGDDGFCSLLRLGLIGAAQDRRYA